MSALGQKIWQRKCLLYKYITEVCASWTQWDEIMGLLDVRAFWLKVDCGELIYSLNKPKALMVA